MNKYKYKKVVLVLVFVLMMSNLSFVYAAEWWEKAFDFFGGTNWNKDASILADLVSLIKLIGNAVFIIVAVVLGIKYMLGSAEGKTDVKEGLISLTVAMVFFYGWSALEEILVQNKNLVMVDRTETATLGNIYSTIIYYLNFVAVGAVIYVGIKYLLSGAEGKADLKGKGVPFIIGMVLSFSTLTFLNFIREIIQDVLE